MHKLMDDLPNSVDVAVFFDFENIVYSLRNNYGINANFEDLMDKCNEFGRVVVARAFADWNRQSSAMIPALMSNGFDPVYVPSFYTNENGKQDLRKNAVDMYLAIDAMDVLHNRTTVDTFILLTGDSDFLPLVNSIRRAGNRVIAIGVDGTVSSHLAQAVDEFIFYSQVSTLPANKFKKRPKDIYEGLTEAIKRLQHQNRSTVLPNVKMMMGELLGGFDEKKHSDNKGRRFQKFKEFVREAEKRRLVQLITTGTVNEVFLADRTVRTRPVREESRDRKRDTRESKDTAKDTRKQEAPGMPLAAAFDLLVKAVEKAAADNRSRRTSSIKGLILDQDSTFDEKKLLSEEGETAFNRFSDFIQAAKKEGLVALKGKGPKMEIHPVKGGESEETESAKPAEKEQPPKEEKAAVKTDISKLAKDQKENFEGRQLIIESMRQFSNYPASFLQIEAYCRQVRNERNIQLPSPKVRELLTEATRQLGILQRISPPGVSPAQYGLNDQPELVATFLGIDVAQPDQEEAGAKAEAPAPAEEKKAEAKTKKAKSKRKKPAAKKEKDAAPKAEATSESEAQSEAKNEQMSLSTAFGLLVTAVNKALSNGKSQKLAAIKRQIKTLEPNFVEANIDNESDDKGFKRFSDFVQAAARDGIVTTKGKGAQTEIHLIEE